MIHISIPAQKIIKDVTERYLVSVPHITFLPHQCGACGCTDAVTWIHKEDQDFCLHCYLTKELD